MVFKIVKYYIIYLLFDFVLFRVHQSYISTSPINVFSDLELRISIQYLHVVLLM
jgi:hypothetical protein